MERISVPVFPSLFTPYINAHAPPCNERRCQSNCDTQGLWRRPVTLIATRGHGCALLHACGWTLTADTAIRLLFASLVAHQRVETCAAEDDGRQDGADMAATKEERDNMQQCVRDRPLFCEAAVYQQTRAVCRVCVRQRPSTCSTMR